MGSGYSKNIQHWTPLTWWDFLKEDICWEKLSGSSLVESQAFANLLHSVQSFAKVDFMLFFAMLNGLVGIFKHVCSRLLEGNPSLVVCFGTLRCSLPSKARL